MTTVELTFLGTGTSVGIPMPCCDCPTCHSSDPRDQRYRASVLLRWERATVVIDTSPEFRLQMLRENVRRLDAVFLTHNHSDHIVGLDDVRPFCFRQGGEIPVYGNAHTLDWVRTRYDYIWNAFQEGGGLPKIELRQVAGPFEFGGLTIVPVPVLHGRLLIYGYRIGDCAYVSDVSEIPASSMDLLRGVRTLILDAVRMQPHATHFHLDKAIAVAREIGAERTFFTHLNHDLPHAETEAYCPPGMAPAYDGLRIQFTA